MSRPIKQGADYFPHYSGASNGRTLYIIESQYGNDGYACWFKLLEMLTAAKGHYYDFNNPQDYQFLLAKTRVSADIFNNVLKTLVILGAIDEELHSQKIIWCQNLVDNLEPLYDRRKSKCPQKPNNSGKKPPSDTVCTNNNPINDNKSTQSKVKESIVKNKNNITGVIFQTFENNYFGRITESTREILVEYIDTYGGENVLTAMSKAIKQNKRSLAYVEGILKGTGDGTHKSKSGKIPQKYSKPEELLQ